MALDRIQARLLRATTALDGAGVMYAVVGGNAVANWVSRVDEAAVRFTADIDVLLRQEDLTAAVQAMESAGFKHRHSGGVDFFTDGKAGTFRDAVHVVLANQKVRPEHPTPAPDVTEIEIGPPYRVIRLEPLVRMKLAAFRDKDRMHLRDMLDVGLIDESWRERLPDELARRLQDLLDHPE